MDGCPRPCNGRIVPLLLFVAIMAALLAGCSLSTPLCDEGDALVAAAQPASALDVYARAKAQGDGCAEEGLETASTKQRRAVEEAARGEVAERAGDLPAATAAYQAALGLDVTNALAVAGLARLGQPEPVPPPPVAAQLRDPSWWAGPWPYFLSSALVSAFLAGAVLWFLGNKLAKLKAEADKSKNLLNAMERGLQSDQGRLDELDTHARTDRALIDAHKQDAAARAQATDSTLRELKAADAGAENARMKLDQELRDQRERIDHLTELIDLSAQAQAEPTSETFLWLEPPSVTGTPPNEGASDDERANGTEGGASADGAMSARDMQVEVNIFAIRIDDGQEVQEQLVIQRVIERGGAGKTDLSAHYEAVPLTEARSGREGRGGQHRGPGLGAGRVLVGDAGLPGPCGQREAGQGRRGRLA